MINELLLRNVLASLLLATTASAADRTLFQFGGEVDLTRFPTTDASVTLVQTGVGAALRLTTGTNQRWPGVTLPAPEGHWDLSPFAHLVLYVRNAGTNKGTLNCRVDNPGADGTRNCVNGSLTLSPGQSSTLKVTLRRASNDTLGGKLFGLRGYPVAAGGPGTVNPANITQILLFVNQPKDGLVFEVDEIRAGGDYVPPTAWVTDADPFFPLIDTFGQYRHKNWPGKVHSLSDLQQRREIEARELAAEPGPIDWNQYGGWVKGPQFKATGFFRTEKYNGKWWLVDPEGRLFFSHGIDCVRMIDATPIEERANWFEDFPGDQDAFRGFRSKGYALKGHYSGRSTECFAFAAANLKRKYGPEWKPAYAEIIHRRLRSWGLNTIANWSDPSVFLMHRTPYTDNVGSRGARNIEGSEGYWGKFPDVFDASFSNSLRRAMEGKRTTSANDPWCIGYFSDNEMSWGNETSLALAALKSPPDQAVKRELIADLKAKYSDIARLNTVWGTSHTSWDALLENRTAPDGKVRGARFYVRLPAK